MDQTARLKNPARIAIIGGGWAGLAAAIELTQRGAQVTVFEAAKQLGGRARSLELHGHTLDNGQHILLGAYRETLRLLQDIGTTEIQQTQLFKRATLNLLQPGTGFQLKLAKLPAPLHLAIGLLFAKGCTLREKRSAALFMRALQATNYQLDSDCSVTELLDRHQQQGNLRRSMWEPLCLAALNTAAENASAQIFANVLRDSLGGSRADTDLLLPNTDLERLFPQAAARFISAQGGEIRLSERIDTLPDNLQIGDVQFEHIILAVAPQHAAKLLATHAQTTAISAQLEHYNYEPIGTLYAGYPADFSLPFPMIGMERSQGGNIGQWVFDRGVLGGSQGVMSFVLSANGAWDDLDSSALANTLHAELEATLGETLPTPTWHQVIRERRATFSCRPGMYRPTMQTPLTGLWLAGDYVCADYPATLEGAVRSGVAVAAAIATAITRQN